MPSEFFVQMQKHHEKLLGLFEVKIKEAENIVSAMVEESRKEKTPKDDLRQMKKKIFEVCKLIYDEQRIAGAQLKEIELKVKQLRSKFTTAMIKHKGYWGSED